MTLEETLVRLSALLRDVDRLGVAYSGGVDSSVLLGLATRVLGPANVVGVIGVSASLAGAERGGGPRRRCRPRGPGGRGRNLRGRHPRIPCERSGPVFHCKDGLFTRISDEVVDRLRLSAVAYGENADDARRPDRPGSRAATAHAVLRPLADLGLTKTDVRSLARDLGLPQRPTSRPRPAWRRAYPLHGGRRRAGRSRRPSSPCGRSGSPTPRAAPR